MNGEDYEASKPTATRTLVTGDPWKRGVRGHDPLCPIARETWCVWSGDACEYCRAIRQAREDAMDRARAAVDRMGRYGTDEMEAWDSAIGYALAAIDGLRGDA